MAIDPDVEAALLPLQEAIDALELRVAQLEATTGGQLFAARDNVETALFSAMQGMTDAQQVTYLEGVAAYLRGGV